MILSRLAFSVNEVVRVACMSHGWFVTNYATDSQGIVQINDRQQ